MYIFSGLICIPSVFSMKCQYAAGDCSFPIVKNPSIHSAKAKFDDSVLPLCAALLAGLAFEHLG